MSQENVRIRLDHFLLEKGVRQAFICKKIALPASVMSQFRKGKKNLYTDHLSALDDFLKQENY